MLFLDRKYLLLVSGRLAQFKEKSPDLYNFRCVFCGDSHKSKIKARGYIHKADKYDGYNYKCFNCSYSTNFYTFLKHIDPLIAREYTMEKFKEEGGHVKREISVPIMELSIDHSKLIRVSDIKLPSMGDLSDQHFAKMYIQGRKIPVEFYDDIFFTTDYKKFLDQVFPDHGKNDLKEEDPRVVFFYTDRAGYITTVCGRSFDANPKLRYLKVKVLEGRKVFGLEKLDIKEQAYLTEGEFDSMFLPNAVASGDSNLAGTAEWLYDTFDVKPVVVFDAEPRNRQIVKGIHDAIKAGFPVVIMPESFPFKDINEAIIAGLSKEEVKSIIDSNIFKGLEAGLKLSVWKKC